MKKLAIFVAVLLVCALAGWGLMLAQRKLVTMVFPKDLSYTSELKPVGADTAMVMVTRLPGQWMVQVQVHQKKDEAPPAYDQVPVVLLDTKGAEMPLTRFTPDATFLRQWMFGMTAATGTYKAKQQPGQSPGKVKVYLSDVEYDFPLRNSISGELSK